MTIEERVAELEARLTRIESVITKPALGATLCSAKTSAGRLCRSRALRAGMLCAHHLAACDREKEQSLRRSLALATKAGATR